MLVQMTLRLPERAIIVSQWRAAIARNETRGIDSRGGISPPLVERKTRESLNAGQVDLPFDQRVPVVKRAVANHESRVPNQLHQMYSVDNIMT